MRLMIQCGKDILILNNMKSLYKLSASLVCANMINLSEEIKSLERGKIDYIHFDVMDGSFVPRFGLHPEMLTAIKKITNIPVDVHLMVDYPEEYISDFAKAGADIIAVHAESTKHLHRVIKKIRDSGIKAGVALNPATPLNVLDYVLDDIDLVVLMAINPGIVGHKLIPCAMNKIIDLRKKLAKHPKIMIQIDGGVTQESAAEMVKKGATMLVCGSSTIFRPPEKIETKIKELRKIIDRKI